MNYHSAPCSPSKTDCSTKFNAAACLGEVCREDGYLATCAGVVLQCLAPLMAWEAAEVTVLLGQQHPCPARGITLLQSEQAWALHETRAFGSSKTR